MMLATWAPLVGEQIAAVTVARMLTRDGTLVVDVVTDAWLHELSRMESRLIDSLRERRACACVKRIRWRVAGPLQPLLELVR